MSDERMARLETLMEVMVASQAELKQSISELGKTLDARLNVEAAKREKVTETLAQQKSDLRLLKSGVLLALLSGGGAASSIIAKILGGV